MEIVFFWMFGCLNVCPDSYREFGCLKIILFIFKNRVWNFEKKLKTPNSLLLAF